MTNYMYLQNNTKIEKASSQFSYFQLFVLKGNATLKITLFNLKDMNSQSTVNF